ncbi:EthD family reductase [Mycobacterium montefiorense]|uniref:Ethyl tert-butyl ether degradation protein EthD n=1 Tax=Mycobacterium montefiorense TaxID=154654 RepID=A0AA37UUU1_9MYCO|nr:EthD family reductase [Mycobacterium montefiorense]GBG40090.1 ethyl tert-butyl ether degradation protein EthD [Mycobacterium montefiorense]GKU36240.1 ethyl tert-butyl ether degradation protein EthD [Mycobacterium montefiorense]GKU38061.1 ethyl tert-butyl ether degradation protein EthD [Mycobacterium montefiorense]GKU45240.1 ethyl tert-butyl ether degradation protein EthD [Mycobacterium montefiorense]GKU52744.1 ethyl tert-butyl ether degradation protein EthD [Mycobacterium montefiorense]
MSETKLTVIYDNPTDPAAFEAAYESEQLEAARRIPGYLRLEASKVWPKEDGSPTPAYRSIDLYYPTYDAVSVAVTTPEAGEFFAAMARLATGGVRVLVSDIEVAQH